MKLNQKIIALFLVIAMINLTPASAMTLGDVNNHMANSLDSYNHMNWWDKIWHVGDVIASLCQVASDLSSVVNDFNNQAINTENEAANLKNKLEYINSQINNRKAENNAEEEYKNAGIADTKRCIESNSKINNITNQSSNKTNVSNNNSHDENKSLTYITNISNNSSNKEQISNNSSINNSNSKESELINNKSNTNSNESITNNSSQENSTVTGSKKTSNKLSVSDYAKKDGEKYPEAYFKSNNIKYSKLVQSISKLKKGQIVQILKDGVFKYWVFNGLTQENGVTYINLVTGNGENYQDDKESFNEDFTGLTYEIDELPDEENPYHSVKKIQELEIQSLESLNNKINEQSTWASISNYIAIVGTGISTLGFIFGAASALFGVILTLASAATATVWLGIPCAAIAAIAAWACVLSGVASVILLVIGLPLAVGGGIAQGVINSINDGDKSTYSRLKDDYSSDVV